MKDSPIDAERLAALLDGRLDERERAEVLAQLASSDDALEAYADAVAVTRELQGEEASTGSVPTPLRPTRPGRSWYSSRGGWLAIAAVLAAVAVAPWLWTRTHSPSPDDPARFVALLGAPESGLPEGWDGGPWSTVRGGEEPPTPEARGVRLGARLVDLQLAVQAQDTAAAGLASGVVALLQAVPAAGPASAVYREIARRAGAPSGELAPLLERGRVAVGRLAGQESVELGAWAEAARIAAARRDGHFFDNAATGAVLRRAGASTNSVALRTRVERIRELLAPSATRNWSMLTSALTELLRDAAS